MKVTEQYDSNMKGKNDQSTIQRLSQVFIHSTINIYMITIWKKNLFIPDYGLVKILSDCQASLFKKESYFSSVTS